MKYLYVLIFLIGRSSPSIAQTEQWQQVAVGDSITVDFPDKPKEIVQSNQQAYNLYSNGVLYSVAVQRRAADPATTVEEKRHLYSEAMKGAAEKFKATQIKDTTRFVVNGFEGLEATFIPTLDKLKNPVTMRMVLINDTFYGQTFSASTDPAYEAARQHFFASFVPRVHPAATTPAETRTTAYRLGQLIGKLAFYAAVIAVVVALLKRLAAPKKNKSIS